MIPHISLMNGVQDEDKTAGFCKDIFFVALLNWQKERIKYGRNLK